MNSIQKLRQLCNKEIARINQGAYRSRPHGEIIHPDIPMARMNEMLKACDEVFKEYDNGVSNTQPA